MLLTGVFLGVIGVTLLPGQMWIQVTKRRFNFRSLSVEGIGAKAAVSTAYVGLIILHQAEGEET